MVPTCYGRQAILDEFEGLRRSNISALMDSNRVVDAKLTKGLAWLLSFVAIDVAVHIGQVRRFIKRFRTYHV